MSDYCFLLVMKPEFPPNCKTQETVSSNKIKIVRRQEVKFFGFSFARIFGKNGNSLPVLHLLTHLHPYERLPRI